MSKENKKMLKPVQLVTEATNKKGKLKGKSKSQTKYLKGICPHHVITKKGKLKPRVFNNGNGECICTLCGARFPAKFYDNDSLHNVVGEMTVLNDQCKFLATSVHAGAGTVDYYSEMGAQLVNYGKNYKKLRSVADKQNNVRKKKKRNNYGSSQYGSWGRR